MDCDYSGGWNLVLAGQAANGEYKVWTFIYGDGSGQAAGTWSPVREVTTSASDSQVSFQWPFVGQPDIYRLFFIEEYSGNFSYKRLTWSHLQAGSAFADNRWREPVPFDLSSTYGVAITGDASTLWLSMPSGVWQGNLAGTPVDVSDDVLDVELEEGPRGGAALLVLRNDNGQYNAPGTGTLAALRPGSEVRVSPGYVTSAGPETVTGPSFSIQGWEYRTGSGIGTFILRASLPWGLLEQWWARRQYSWALGSTSVASILQFLLARAGMALDVSGASTICSTLAPAFTVHPGENGVSAVRRLLAIVPDVLLFQGLAGVLKNPQDSDATDYSYGTDHSILSGRYVSTALEANRAQVFGQAGMAEAFEWDEITDVHDRLRQVHDLNLDTQQKVTDRATTELRHQVLGPIAGVVAVPTNCGQELYDVVEVTDASAGLSGARYRVQGIRWEYRRQRRAAYSQTVTLGQP